MTDPAAADRVEPPSRQVTSPDGSTGQHVATDPQVGPRTGRRTREGRRDRAHPADRHVPLPRAAADDVVEEADVLQQVLRVHGRERPDEAVGRHHPADHVVTEVLPHQRPQRHLGQPHPQLLVVDNGTDVVGRTQRLDHRRPEPLGQAPDPGMEVAPPGILLVAQGERAEGVCGRGRIGVVDEQPPARVLRVGRVRGVPAPGQTHVEVELLDELARQQGHQVRVARQPGVDTLEDPCGDRRTPDVTQLLQDEHPPARPSQVCRGGEPVVPGPHDDVVVRHETCVSHGTVAVGVVLAQPAGRAPVTPLALLRVPLLGLPAGRLQGARGVLAGVVRPHDVLAQAAVVVVFHLTAPHVVPVAHLRLLADLPGGLTVCRALPSRVR